jgi:pre-mRNA-splicing factor SYF1
LLRYGGKKLERARDLFEHALSMAPPEEMKPLFMEVGENLNYLD